ncbi:hypothetical protein [Fusibacter bizertensis]
MNILFGNGITLQFGNSYYSNTEIVKTLNKLIKNKSFPQIEIFSKENVSNFEVIFNKLDEYIKKVLNDEPEILSKHNIDIKDGIIDFRDRYKNYKVINKLTIGFEDYFLIFEIIINDFFSVSEIIELEKEFSFHEFLSMIFKYVIFNNGEINEIYLNYPSKFVEFLNSKNAIFTTNYDRNLELASNTKVFYLHGAFHRPATNLDYTKLEQYSYLNSNAIMNYSGVRKKNRLIQKENVLTGGVKARQNLSDLSIGAKSNPLAAKLKTFILNIFNDKDEINYSELKNIKGKLEVVGMSPNNDRHIFEAILANKNITELIYYYYSEEDYLSAKDYFEDNAKYENVNNLWITFS